MRKLTLCGASLLTATALGGAGALANDKLIEMAQNPADWVMPTGDYANTRYSELDQITRDNVGDLQVAWTKSTGVLRGHEGQPLVIGDMMYYATPFPNNVFAVNLADEGKIEWTYEPKQDPQVIGVMCCDTVYRGVSYAPAEGDRPAMILLQQADTTLVALNAETGEPIWEVKNGDPSVGETATMAPMVYKDKVYTGISGGEYGVQGHLTAYDLATGEQAWRGYSTGPDDQTLMDPENTTHLGEPVGEDSGTATWEGDTWKIGGGTTWGWFSFDPELNLIYYGTGNPGTWNPSQRPGDNRWSMTIFARDADTGMAKWVYQMTPHDEWDYDGVNEMILADLEMDGETVPALVHFDRNGFAYTLNRETGELLLAEKYDPAVNWASHIEMDPESEEYGRPQVVAEYSTSQAGEDVNVEGICPAALGSKDQQPASFSPKTGIFYVPTNHVCMDYEPFRVSYTAGQPYVGATLSMYPAPDSHGGMGNMIAWDATEGEIVWSLPEKFSVWSGVLSTAGDVVFYGTLEGHLKAVDAETGEELYSFKTPSGIIGNVMSYEHEGKQHIAVLSGIGGWAGIGLAAGLENPQDGLGAVGGYASLKDYTALGGQLTVFAVPDELAAAE